MSTLLTSSAPSPLTSYEEAINTFNINNTNGNTITANSIINHTVNCNMIKSSGSSSSSSSSPSAATNSSSKSSSQNSLSSARIKPCKDKSITSDACLENASSQLTEQNISFLMCYICRKKLTEPKLLHCLHAFCRMCLVVNNSGDCVEMQPHALNCPRCQQETIINRPNGIDSLEDDYVTQNLLDMMAIEEMILDCTSCKTDAKAVARCSDCAQFLCPNCVSAHQYMRCFENHRVVKFQDIVRSFKNCAEPRSVELRISSCGSSSSSTCSNSSNEVPTDLFNHEIVSLNAVPIHKPLFCKSHNKESLKFFCNTCQIPICTECVVSQHQRPLHSYERLSDAESKNIEEIQSLVRKTKDKIQECQGDFQLLDQYLSDLEEQREQCKGLIEETYQSYRTLLEKRKNDLLNELDKKHSLKELAIIDLNQNIQSSIDQLFEVIKFIERVLKNGNCPEILLLKNLIVNQIRFLTNNLPITDHVDVNLKFLTDQDRFEKAVFETFGRFQTQKELKQIYLNNLTSSTSNNESLMLASKSISNNPNVDQQRLQQIQNIQKQIELQQAQQNFSKTVSSFHSPIDQEWLVMNMLNNNQFKQQANANGIVQYDIHQSPTDEWLTNLAKQQQQTSNLQFENKNSFPHCPSLSPESSSSTTSNPWINPSAIGNQQLHSKNNLTQQQIILNNLNTLSQNNSSNFLATNMQKQSVRPNSPLLFENSILTNSSTSLQQHQLFLQQQQQMNNSRCQTPSTQQQQQQQFNILNQTKHYQIQNDLVTVTNALNIGSNLNNISNFGTNASNNNQLVVNGLDEYMPFGNNTSSMAQNFNHLSKLISNQQVNDNSLTDLAALNMNLNEITSNNNGYAASKSETFPKSIQSPTAGPVGSSSTSNHFSGNGNLNPPVRQNGKMTNMQIRTKFGMLGQGKSQFNSPHGFCLGVDEDIVVADTNNNRIQIFDKNGEFKYCFGIPGREAGQLWYPRKVAVNRESGKFVVCDRGTERSRMQIFSQNGVFIRKISIRYIDIVAGLAITQQGEIVAVDSVSPTVFRITEAGELVKWFDCSEYMREPSDIAICGTEYFVCDFKGHCVVVFTDDGTFMRRIGGENITNFPNGIDVSDAGDVLVGDSHGNRFHVAIFSRKGEMLNEFECPYVKVSRCCGLKITSEGLVVTLAKNNHHVLVLNTLFVS